VMRFAGGFSAARWWMRKNPEKSATHAATLAATHAATNDATYAATHAATLAATHAATNDATNDATHAATNDATYAATHAATDAATLAATDAATHAATDAATHAATHAATDDVPDLSNWYFFPANAIQLAHELGVGLLGLRCAAESYRFWQGGNQWSGYDSFLSFFRHIAHLPIDYSAWDAWETLSLHSGPRLVHADFCMISDRPEVLTVDEQNRPHSTSGPFCRWRDGSALYSVHGTRVPGWLIERPHEITVEKIEAESNVEIRRVMIDLYGKDRYILDSGATVVHRDDWGTLYRREQADDEPLVMVKVVNSTPEPDGSFKDYFLRVHPELRPFLADGFGEPQAMTARNAVASTFGLRGEEYHPTLQS